jgi:hypothetical protein
MVSGRGGVDSEAWSGLGTLLCVFHSCFRTFSPSNSPQTVRVRELDSPRSRVSGWWGRVGGHGLGDPSSPHLLPSVLLDL